MLQKIFDGTTVFVSCKQSVAKNFRRHNRLRQLQTKCCKKFSTAQPSSSVANKVLQKIFDGTSVFVSCKQSVAKIFRRHNRLRQLQTKCCKKISTAQPTSSVANKVLQKIFDGTTVFVSCKQSVAKNFRRHNRLRQLQTKCCKNFSTAQPCSSVANKVLQQFFDGTTVFVSLCFATDEDGCAVEKILQHFV